MKKQKQKLLKINLITIKPRVNYLMIAIKAIKIKKMNTFFQLI